MKIRALMATGDERLIEIEGPVALHEGEYMNRLTDNNGVDHFFLHDGSYDGWGIPVSLPEAPPASQGGEK